MAEFGLKILNGTELRSGDLRLPIAGGSVNGERVLAMAEAEAAVRLFGLSLPDSMKSAVLRRLGSGADDFLSVEFNEADLQKRKIQEYLIALADELEDDPLVVSILDGSALRVFLDDEDDFAMVAENLFTELDTNDTGKLSKSKLQDALDHMGIEMGVPPFSASGDILSNILKRHGAEGEEQLGQAQFAQLLQPILQDLVDALAEKHVVVIQNIKVINGSRLKKILNDKNLLDDITERLFHAWQDSSNGAWNKEILANLLQEKHSELGLPPYNSNEEISFLYDQIFSNISEEKVTACWNKESFQDEIKAIFKMLTDVLEANPVFIDRES
ncbi:uncharacterized protein LOC110031764 isoform X1 [Phalaenopsis equestris]|uniref:uncharacterized protein LOC110031764 isoform X1 n=1 Tax=Phalaenopsis equestris TaxID=78828 RepID=UPI0009E37FD9|nr:uncharacterized protein LOC110031764 isoform X1 [Phalaenopsis equestris]